MTRHFGLTLDEIAMEECKRMMLIPEMAASAGQFLHTLISPIACLKQSLVPIFLRQQLRYRYI